MSAHRLFGSLALCLLALASSKMMTFEDDDESLACEVSGLQRGYSSLFPTHMIMLPPKDIGFDPAKTHCSGCEKLAKYVKDESLAKECFECCVEDRKRYGQAALHVCKEGLAQMEELKGFIEEDAEQFTKLKIVYTKPRIYMGMAMCSQPALKLQDDSGADEEAVEIHGWKRDQLREFLAEKIPPESAAA